MIPILMMMMTTMATMTRYEDVRKMLVANNCGEWRSKFLGKTGSDFLGQLSAPLESLMAFSPTLLHPNRQTATSNLLDSKIGKIQIFSNFKSPKLKKQTT